MFAKTNSSLTDVASQKSVKFNLRPLHSANRVKNRYLYLFAVCKPMYLFILFR